MIRRADEYSAYGFQFGHDTDMTEVRDTLKLSLLAAEAIHGAAQVALDARCTVDDAGRMVTVDARSEVGADVARLFMNYASREFDGMSVARLRHQAIGGGDG